jgi:tetratricopeptide (TPR) repeat protein
LTKATRIQPDILFINDIGDGGSKDNKFSRDITLLTQGIIDEPYNDRYYFYLANSYYDTSQYTEAIPIYNKKISLGGWIQEIWYSYYRLGLCYYYLKEYEKAIYYLLEAYQITPLRVENISIIILIYTELTNHTHLINMFMDVALNIINTITPDVKNSYLFLENNIYTYDLYVYKLLNMEDTISNNNKSYLTKILNNCLEPSKIIEVIKKIWSYKDHLTPINSVVLQNIMCFHSCIIPYTNQPLPLEINETQVKYIVNIITSQFDILIFYMNVNGEVINGNLTILENPNKLYNMIIIDDSYISYKLKYIFIGKYSNKSNLDQSVRVIPTPMKLEDSIKDTTNTHNNLISNIKIIQKPNYMYTYFKKNTIIYNWYPLIIGDIDGKIINTSKTPNIFNYITGGINTAVYINTKDWTTEYWTIAQIRVDDEIPLKIMHMFIVFDINYNVIQYSNPLLLDNSPNIICHSLTMNDNTIIVTYLFDNQIKISIYNLDLIRNHMNIINPN